MVIFFIVAIVVWISAVVSCYKKASKAYEANDIRNLIVTVALLIILLGGCS